jgi:hypothetical protein
LRQAAENIEHLHTLGHGPRAQAIDMAFHEVVRMLVVAAKHAAVRMFVEQRPKFAEILGRRSLADEDLLPEGQLFEGLLQLETFMVGLDAGRNIGFEVRPAQAWGVSVDALAVFLGDVDFPHDVGIAVDDTGEIHHFREVDERGVGAEFLDGFRSQRGAGRFEIGRGHAGWDAEMDFAGCLRRQFLHVADALRAEHVGDFVRVGNRGHRAVDHRDAGELGRGEHGTLDVHMGVDETRAQVALLGDAVILAHRGDFSARHLDISGKDAATEKIDDFAAVSGRSGGSHGGSLGTGGEAAQGCQRALEWQTDDIGAAAFHRLDDHLAMLLQGVGARFVEHVDAGEISFDLIVLERTEAHAGCFVEFDVPPRFQAHEVDSGGHFVHATGQAGEHFPRLRRTGRFAEGLSVEPHQCVGADHDGVGVTGGHRQRFGAGIGRDQASQSERGVVDFHGITALGRKFQSCRLQQLPASRRGGGQNDPRPAQ